MKRKNAFINAGIPSDLLKLIAEGGVNALSPLQLDHYCFVFLEDNAVYIGQGEYWTPAHASIVLALTSLQISFYPLHERWSEEGEARCGHRLVILGRRLKHRGPDLRF